MSIEIDNPETILEKIDVVANLIKQMYLAVMVDDKKRFEDTYRRANGLLFNAKVQLEKKS